MCNLELRLRAGHDPSLFLAGTWRAVACSSVLRYYLILGTQRDCQADQLLELHAAISLHTHQTKNLAKSIGVCFERPTH